MQLNEGVAVKFLQILSQLQLFVMSIASVWVSLVCCVFVSGVKWNGCPQGCLCYTWGRLMRTDCVGKNFLNISIGIPSKTQVLDLSHNAISILHKNEFKDYYLIGLQDLRLSNNHLHKIDKLSFSALLFLQNLDLSFNSIEYLDPKTFWSNLSLKTLNLSFNPLSFEKEKHFLMGFNSIQILDMSGCKLEFITKRSFFELNQLKVLNVSRNHIKTIEVEFLEKMKNLRYLDVSKNDLPCNNQTKLLLQTLEHLEIQYRVFCQVSQKILTIPDLKTEENSSLIIELYQEDYSKNVTKHVSPKRSVLDEVSQFFQSIPSFYVIVAGIQVGVFIGSFSTYFCLKKSVRRPDVSEDGAEEGRKIGDSEGYALIPIQRPPGTPPSPYHSRFFSSNFSHSAS